MIKKSVDYFFPLGEKRLKRLETCLDDKNFRQRMENARILLAKEKKFYPGCRIQWKKKPEVIRILKGVSKQGFLLLVDSRNRESPADWDVCE